MRSPALGFVHEGDPLSAEQENLLRRVASHGHAGSFYENIDGVINFPPVSSQTQRGYPFRNDSGETAPAYGCMEVTGIASGPILDEDGYVTITVTKPSTTLRRLYVINMASDVEDGATGRCFVPGQDSPCVALYEDGPPDIGVSYGPKPAKWELYDNYPAVVDCIGLADGNVIGNLHPIESFPIMLKESLTPGSTDPKAYPTDSTGTILDATWYMEVTDLSGDLRAIGKDDVASGDGAKGLVEVLGDGTLAIVRIQQRAKMCYCKAKIAAGNIPSTVDNVAPMDGGQNPVDSTADDVTLSVSATGWETDDNANGIIAWDETNDAWRPLDFPCKT